MYTKSGAKIFVFFCTGSFSEKREYTVFYIGTREGQVYKVAQWSQDGQLKSNLLDIFQV